jgi:hypothetical protein
MSLTPKVAKVETPAAAPAAAAVTTPEQKLGSDKAGSSEVARKRKGRAGLRIDLQSGGAGVSAGATGVNVPIK